MNGMTDIKAVVERLSEGYKAMTFYMLKYTLRYFDQKSLALHKVNPPPQGNQTLGDIGPGRESANRTNAINTQETIDIPQNHSLNYISPRDPQFNLQAKSPTLNTVYESPRQDAVTGKRPLGQINGGIAQRSNNRFTAGALEPLASRFDSTAQLRKGEGVRRDSALNSSGNDLEASFYSRGNGQTQDMQTQKPMIIESSPPISFQLEGYPIYSTYELNLPKPEDEEQLRLENEKLAKEQHERDEILKAKQKIDQIKSSGSDQALRQVLRNFKDSKVVDKSLVQIEQRLMAEALEDVDIGEMKDQLLSVYDKTQYKTAKRVLKFANKKDRNEAERRIVTQNSKATEVVHEILSRSLMLH